MPDPVSAPIAIAPETFSPGEVLRMVNAQANALFSQLGTLGTVDVVGVLGPVRDSRYSTCYGLELRDGADTLLMDVPKALNPQEYAGREVKVRGVIQAKKGLQVALQVSRLRLTTVVNPEVLKEEKSIREIFQKANAGEDTFPPLTNLTVSLIHGINSQVLADFRNQVADLVADLPEVDWEFVGANLQEPESIVTAIQRAAGAVIVLIRGGGNEGDFEVFNRPAVLEAWRSKEAFKVTALGHTQNNTLLDRLSHKVCDTPTAAGKYLLEQAQIQLERTYWRDRAEKAATLQNQAVLQAQTEGAKKAEALQIQVNTLLETQKGLEVERATLKGEIQRSRELLAAQQSASRITVIPRWVWIALPLLTFLGVLAGWLLAHRSSL